MNRDCYCGRRADPDAVVDGRAYCHHGNPSCYDHASWLRHLRGRAETVHTAAVMALRNNELALAGRLLIIESELREENLTELTRLTYDFTSTEPL